MSRHMLGDLGIFQRHSRTASEARVRRLKNDALADDCVTAGCPRRSMEVTTRHRKIESLGRSSHRFAAVTVFFMLTSTMSVVGLSSEFAGANSAILSEDFESRPLGSFPDDILYARWGNWYVTEEAGYGKFLSSSTWGEINTDVATIDRFPPNIRFEYSSRFIPGGMSNPPYVQQTMASVVFLNHYGFDTPGSGDWFATLGICGSEVSASWYYFNPEYQDGALALGTHTPMEAGVWYNVVGVFDGDWCGFYLNGEMLGEVMFGDIIPFPLTDFFLYWSTWGTRDIDNLKVTPIDIAFDSASDSSVAVGSSATLKAVLDDGLGVPVHGVPVTFYCDSPAVQITQISDRTDMSGTATATAVASQPGVYSVIAKTPGGLSSDEWELAVVSSEPINALVDINPDTLNLRSMGKWITVYIELPEGCDVGDVLIESVVLDDHFPATGPSGVGDFDEDGVQELMVKFDRSRLFRSNDFTTSEAVTMTVSGTMENGTAFQGTDDIRIVGANSKSSALGFSSIGLEGTEILQVALLILAEVVLSTIAMIRCGRKGSN